MLDVVIYAGAIAAGDQEAWPRYDDPSPLDTLFPPDGMQQADDPFRLLIGHARDIAAAREPGAIEDPGFQNRDVAIDAGQRGGAGGGGGHVQTRDAARRARGIGIADTRTRSRRTPRNRAPRSSATSRRRVGG